MDEALRKGKTCTDYWSTHSN